jgi:hypothetical protein
VLARRLQDGDPGGEMRNAMARFPAPGIAEQVLQRHFRPAGRSGRPYRGISMHSHRDKHASQDLLALAAFEVMLSKRDHHGRIGINLLTKVASVPGTLSEREVYTARTRTCDLGYRETYVKPRGGIGYRCAAEPVADYVAKGGDAAATVGLGQVRAVGIEPGLVTSGDGLGSIRAVLGDRDDYSAADVVTHLMSDVPLAVSR